MSDTVVDKETLGFQTEVSQLLHLVTHALYSNKEIFLRELISNASDAADKLRFEAVSNDALYEKDPQLKITVSFDKEAKTITIEDNGIGMSREEIIENLGTIAKSGTREFLKNLTQDKATDSNLIGQFGVGFYSAFIVADKVSVKSRRAGLAADQAVMWESTGEANYTLEAITQEKRGTEITLHLKQEEEEFLDDWRLRNIITKYSDHISFPVMMQKQEMPSADTDKNEGEGEDKEPQDQQPKPVEYEAVNRATALWTLPKNKIKDEEYTELYKHISHDFEEPLTWMHNRVEGKLEYTSLLYIPARAPFDMFNRDTPRGLKLYVQRVFIMDNADVLLPLYLRFVKGIVDTNDLQLNISREILQNNKTIDSLKVATTKRILDMLEKLIKDDPEKYAKFWQEFGAVLKEGIAEDFANRDKIAGLLRFATTYKDESEQSISLDDYIDRMREGQDKIYYVTADSFAAAKNSPHLEIFRKKGIEVILLHDRVDEWLVVHLQEYQGKQLQSVTKGALDLGELEDEAEKQAHKQVEDDFADFITKVKDSLQDQVKDVRITHRLTASPACIVAEEQDMGMNIQRILKAAGQDVPTSQPVLELNPEHPVIARLKTESNETRFNEWSHILLQQAILAEGGQLEDPASFVARLNSLWQEIA